MHRARPRRAASQSLRITARAIDLTQNSEHILVPVKRGQADPIKAL